MNTAINVAERELTTAELELVAGGVTMDEYIWDLAIIGGGLFDAGCVWASNRPVGVLGAGLHGH